MAARSYRDTVMQFFGRNRSFFSEVVLVDLYNSGVLATGFVTDDQGKYLTVFVPTGPNPTSGNIFHLKGEYVYPVKVPVEEVMRSIISCGAGSTKLIDAYNRQIKTASMSRNPDTAN